LKLLPVAQYIGVGLLVCRYLNKYFQYNKLS